MRKMTAKTELVSFFPIPEGECFWTRNQSQTKTFWLVSTQEFERYLLCSITRPLICLQRMKDDFYNSLNATLRALENMISDRLGGP